MHIYIEPLFSLFQMNSSVNEMKILHEIIKVLFFNCLLPPCFEHKIKA
jgi:hypothetical protein